MLQSPQSRRRFVAQTLALSGGVFLLAAGRHELLQGFGDIDAAKSRKKKPKTKKGRKRRKDKRHAEHGRDSDGKVQIQVNGEPVRPDFIHQEGQKFTSHLLPFEEFDSPEALEKALNDAADLGIIGS